MSTYPEFEIFCEQISKDDGFNGFTPWRCSTRRQLWERYEEPDWRLSAPNSLSVDILKILQLADTFIFLFACWDPEIILWTVALVGAIYAMAILPGVGYFPMTHVEFYLTALSLNQNPPFAWLFFYCNMIGVLNNSSVYYTAWRWSVTRSNILLMGLEASSNEWCVCTLSDNSNRQGNTCTHL